MVARFAVEYVYTADTAKRDEIRPAHRAFLREAQDRGELLVSGPWVNNTGALLVFEAEDEAALKKLLEHDPFAEADLVARVRINEFNPVLGTWVAD
ncbi:YciI family protein [Catenulispora pinistramenti]|uniref:YciI family protein n=1 Tax=Catenulispora pinistramenti TaxID=2705254 RepID=UPI001E61468F|nr:YciI family protein [Catenulispora pinistramenti]